MSTKNRLKILIGVLCLVLVLLVTVVVLILNNQSPSIDSGISQPESSSPTGESQNPTETTGNIPGETKPADDEDDNDPQETEPADDDPQETEPADDDPQETEPADDDPQETEPADDEDDSEDEDEDENEDDDPPDDLPPSIDIPPDEDPESGEEIGVSFPCEVPGYDLIIEKLAPYSGMFVENGSNVTVENVAMLLVKNNGSLPVEYTQIRVECGQEEYLFDISALPAGEKLVVQEKTGKTISDCKATAVSAMIVQRADMEMSEGKVQVTDNGNNTLTVKNLTNETISTVRIFYKYYMEDEELFVGGIAFTVRISRLGVGASVTIQPSHYSSQTSRVVMVLTYDSEV